MKILFVYKNNSFMNRTMDELMYLSGGSVVINSSPRNFRARCFSCAEVDFVHVSKINDSVGGKKFHIIQFEPNIEDEISIEDMKHLRLNVLWQSTMEWRSYGSTLDSVIKKKEKTHFLLT